MPRRARTVSEDINVAFIRTSNFYFSQEEEQSRRPTAFQSTIHPFLFLLQVLVNFVDLKYQGKHFSSFDTHPAITWIAIASFFLYCFACDNELRLSSDHRCAVLFGWLSSVSLASILYPDFSPVLFLLYVLFLVGVLLNSRLQGLWNWVQQRMRPNPFPEERIPDWNVGRGRPNPWINPEWPPELLNLRVEQLLWNWVQQRMSGHLDIPHWDLHIPERHMGRPLINPNRNRIGRLPV